MVFTSSGIGTGNIVGIAGASAFAESVLARIYKKKGIDDSCGSPAYYIKYTLENPASVGVFAVELILT